MTSPRWLGVSIALGIAVVAFASCKSSTIAGTGAAGGAGGAGTGGSTTTTHTTTGTGGAKGDGGPIACTATYTNIPKTGPCDLLDQNCPAGTTCDVEASATKCIPSSGLKGADENCYSSDECDAKLVCLGLNLPHPGSCVAFCCPDADNAPCNGGICNLKVEFGGGLYAYACTYGQRCQLLAAAACPPGEDCHIETAAGQGVAVCITPSPTLVPELGACSYINDCGNMQDCFGLGGTTTGTCLYYCALMGPNTTAAPGLGGCPMGETCQSTYEGQPVNTGVDGVGLCIPIGGIVPPDAGAGDAGDAGPGDAGDAGVNDAGVNDASASDAGDGGDDAGGPDAQADAGVDAGDDGGIQDAGDG